MDKNESQDVKMDNEKKDEDDLEFVEAEVADDLQYEKKEEINEKEGQLINQLQRLQADFSNYKKRTEKEKQDNIKYASLSLITKLLPVLDNLDRAYDNMNNILKDGEVNEKDKSFYEGFEMIRDEFVKILNDEGLEEIKSNGEKFDANYHHAVFMEESEDVDSGYIIDTFQKGYMINNRVIRPAMVKVSK